MVIDYGQQQALRQHVNKAVLNALGGKNTEAYAYISKVVFAECNRDLQDRFKVNSRNNIPRKRYEEAIDYVDNWEPKTNTKLRPSTEIRGVKMEVGDIRGMLAIARKARGITQKELAERCGLAEVTIRKYETGRRFPNAETLKRITKELGVKIVVIPEKELGGE